MAGKTPFFEFFTSLPVDFELRLALDSAVITNIELDQEARTMRVELLAREHVSEAVQEKTEALIAQQFGLVRVTLAVTQIGMPREEEKKETSKGKKERDPGKPIMGKAIKGKVSPMSSLNSKSGKVVVEGKVFKFEYRETKRPGMWSMTMAMTDYGGSVFVRKRLFERELAPLREKIVPGMYLRVAGNITESYRAKSDEDFELSPTDISIISHEERMDTAEEKRVELHLHTKMSNMR